MFSWGCMSRMYLDSVILSEATSVQVRKILMLKVEVVTLMFGCWFFIWSPKGVSVVLFFASRRCSLKRNRTCRLVSPMYEYRQTVQLISYTTFLVVHFPSIPASHALHVLWPEGQIGGHRAERTRMFARLSPLFHATLIGRLDERTLALILREIETGPLLYYEA